MTYYYYCVFHDAHGQDIHKVTIAASSEDEVLKLARAFAKKLGAACRTLEIWTGGQRVIKRSPGNVLGPVAIRQMQARLPGEPVLRGANGRFVGERLPS